MMKLYRRYEKLPPILGTTTIEASLALPLFDTLPARVRGEAAASGAR
jgi:hypothetical protein